MTDQNPAHVFLSYSEGNQDTVEGLARRLQGDARLTFWFGSWHSIPGKPRQEQMEEALLQAQACAVFIGGETGQIEGWQTEQMRAAIQTRVEDDAAYRVIPVLLPGAARPKRRDLPPFLRLYEPVEFRSLDDELAFKRLLAGILGKPPIEIEGYIKEEIRKEYVPLPPSAVFGHGHALVIGVAHYPQVRPLPETVLKDARDLQAVLTDPAICGYPAAQVTQLLDEQATNAAIRTALADLAACVKADDTAIVYFSGHGAYEFSSGKSRQYLLPVDCNPADLSNTAISGDEMTALLTAIKAGRLLVLFDSCHSGGAGDPKSLLPEFKAGLDEDYYAGLAQGKGRVVMAAARPAEFSWVFAGMNNSVFTHYLLEALRGQAKTLGDGYIRIFDLFRYVANHVPVHAKQQNREQHPIFKATAMEEDFPIALTRR